MKYVILDLEMMHILVRYHSTIGTAPMSIIVQNIAEDGCFKCERVTNFSDRSFISKEWISMTMSIHPLFVGRLI